MNMSTIVTPPTPLATKETTCAWLGIDVSKGTFDAALLTPEMQQDMQTWRKMPAKNFPRTPEGVKACYAWAVSLLRRTASAPVPSIRVVMEATGKYSLELSAWFATHAPITGPAILNPRMTKAYSDSLSITNRTDNVDARTLARCGAERKPAAYAPAEPQWAQLRDLTRYRQALVEQRQAEENRAAEITCSALVRKTQNRRIIQLKRDIINLDNQIKALVEKTPAMKESAQLLQTIQGVGPVVAMTVLGELGDLRRFQTARQMTAFAGLAPTHHDSGTSVHKKSHMSKCGSAHVRRILFLAALHTSQRDNDFADTYNRLVGEGKKKMVAMVAVMRKILVVMRAVLISGKAYQPHYNKTRSVACG
jgi:transposase